MLRWVLFSLLVVAVAAIGTVASFYLTPAPTSALSSIRPTPSAEAPTGPPGKAVVLEGSNVYDFGILPKKTIRTHDWTIANQGQGDLKLEMGQVSCSCTSSDMKLGDSVTLKPGEKKVFKIEFNTKDWDKFHQTAPIIVHNDPDTQRIELTIDGTVRPAVMTYPTDRVVSLATINNDSPVSRDVALFSFDRPDVKILDVLVSDPKAISVEKLELTPEECKKFEIPKGRRLTFSIKPSPKLGQFVEEVTVKLDHPSEDTVKFTVTGKREGPISLTPDRIRLFNVASKQGAVETLTVLVRNQEATKFTVEQQPKGVEVTISPMGKVPDSKVQRYALNVKIQPNLPAGSIIDDIVIKTDHPNASELKIPVAVVIGQGG